MDKHVVAKEGELVTVEIPVSGWPLPRLTWKRDGRPFYPDGNVTTEVTENGVVLKFKGVKRSDEGVYRLEMQNDHGKCSLNVHLKVYGRSTSS